MTNRITQAERDRIDQMAAEYLAQNISYDNVISQLMADYGISQERARRAMGKSIRRRNRPGAPAGNTNAARKDKRPRKQLNIRVEQSTMDWLQSKANEETNGNIGRLLDRLTEQ